jgi:MFS family permease
LERKKIFSRTVILLSLVSLFNDISSEMLLPILPAYLSTIGFTALWIGVLEGIAEAVSGLSKAYFGKLSDSFKLRTPFVKWGYAMSAVSKSMLALFTFPVWIFLSRTLDRLGKGVRTAARDALLADESIAAHRGKVFGLNKAMDTLGATVGAAFAAVYLYYFPERYRQLFLIAFVPAVIAVAIIFIVKEKAKDAKTWKGVKNAFSFFGYWKSSSSSYKKLVAGFLLFALFNSSDAFIFLLGKHVGLSDSLVLTAYISYNLLFALLALPFGHLADKLGMKYTYLIGIIFFGLAYFIFPHAATPVFYFISFFLYAIYAASTDGISKAWISHHCKPDNKATALGFYSGSLSLVILASNLLGGFLWSLSGPKTLFLVSAAGAGITFLYFSFYSPVENNGSSTESGFSA